MAQTDDPGSRDRLIQALKRQYEAGSTCPVPPDHPLAGGRDDCVLEILAIRESMGYHTRPTLGVTWSVHPRGERFYDAGAVNGNMPVERFGDRFPFLLAEAEKVGGERPAAQAMGVKIA